MAKFYFNGVLSATGGNRPGMGDAPVYFSKSGLVEKWTAPGLKITPLGNIST